MEDGRITKDNCDLNYGIKDLGGRIKELNCKDSESRTELNRTEFNDDEMKKDDKDKGTKDYGIADYKLMCKEFKEGDDSGGLVELNLLIFKKVFQ